MEFFCTVPRLHFLGRALIWPGCFGERILGVFGLYSSSLSKSVGFVSLSGKASLVSISAAILFLRSWHVYFPLEFEFRGKSCVEWEHVGENGTSCFLPCILLLHKEWIWTNYCKLSLNFVWAIRTTTINCRVSFTDLYLVFPRNCRMVFLPHTNTVILLEPCCGTMTKPGLPVMVLTKTIIASGNGIGQILLRIMSVNKPSLSLSLKSGFRFRRIHWVKW